MVECSRRAGVGSWVYLWFHTVMGRGVGGWGQGLGGWREEREGEKRGMERREGGRGHVSGVFHKVLYL